jgi:hypothetical protein
MCEIYENNIEYKRILFKEYIIQKKLDYKLKTTKLPKYIPLPFN